LIGLSTRIGDQHAGASVHEHEQEPANCSFNRERKNRAQKQNQSSARKATRN
jgi:hypothetical protein